MAQSPGFVPESPYAVPKSPREDDVVPESPLDDEEDLAAQFHNDYKAIPSLDRYEKEGLDEAVQPNSPGFYYAFDAQTEDRKRERDQTQQCDERPSRRRRMDWNPEWSLDFIMIHTYLIPHEVRMRRALCSHMNRFLKHAHTNNPTHFYKSEIETMCMQNRSSLFILESHLASFEDGKLFVLLMDYPSLVLPIFDQALTEMVLEEFPHYLQIRPRLFVRIRHLNTSNPIRNLDATLLNRLVQIRGVVIQRTIVGPVMEKVKLKCQKESCRKETDFYERPFGRTYLFHEPIEWPSKCPFCGCAKALTICKSTSVFRNIQKIVLQEPSKSVPSGRLPATIAVHLTDDLVQHSISLGDDLQITGFLFTAQTWASHAYVPSKPILMANSITNFSESQHTKESYTEQQMEEFRAISEDPFLFERLRRSFAPSIYGNELIKDCLLAVLFGGVPKLVDQTQFRGDIHLLMVGDPGTAKSEFLQYIGTLFPKTVYSTGKGSSAVGLTAAVRKDHLTNEMVLDGGAMVMADRGICVIDEFDKMNGRDRSAIHEAMEQQSITIQKAGISASLNARCSVIAAANPVYCRYKAELSLEENVDFLQNTILSRFDLICIMRDRFEESEDLKLAEFITRAHQNATESKHNHQQSNESRSAEPIGAKAPDTSLVKVIPLEKFQSYLLYARHMCQPQFASSHSPKIESFYAVLRKLAPTMIAPRHISAIIRLSEAMARMQLKLTVDEDDVDRAIHLFAQMFLGTVRVSYQVEAERKLKPFMYHEADVFPAIIQLITNTMFKKTKRYDISKDELFLLAMQHNISNRQILLFLHHKDYLAQEQFRYDSELEILLYEPRYCL
jgi:DNA replication licensing factor MCM2